MSKVILNLAMSLDGFIARQDGSVDFLSGDLPEGEITEEMPESFKEFLDSIDVIVMGRKSYEKTISFGEYPFKDKTTYVVTSNPIKSDEVIYTDKPIIELINELKEVSKNNIWLFGGAMLIDSFKNEDLIDEYIITIVPEIIGNGIPLFLDGEKEVRLRLIDVEKNGELITLSYERKI